MTRANLLKKSRSSSSSLSVRSLGTGEIAPSPDSKSWNHNHNDGREQHHRSGGEDGSPFVVRNFRGLTSTWLHYHQDEANDNSNSNSNSNNAEKQKPRTTKFKSLSTQDTFVGSGSGTDSDRDESEEEMVDEHKRQNQSLNRYNAATDLAYHDASEQEGAELVRRALTPEEESAMPDEFMPLRHYRAEKGDAAKAIAAIKHTLQWRKEFDVDNIVTALEDDEAKKTGNHNHDHHCNNYDNDNDNDNRNIETNDGEEEDLDLDLAAILRKENETGKIYVRGYDKDGRAMMYMRPGRENTMHEDNNMRHLVFQIEKAVRCSQKNGHGKICLVIDYEGFHISKTPPMSTTKRTLDILQRHFCERMYRAYICNPPFVFRSFYAVIKPFVDPVTKQKICWCVGKKGMDQVVEDVGGPEKAKAQLEKCCGGSGEFVRDFDSEEYMHLPLTMAFDEAA